MCEREYTRHDDKAASRLAPEGVDGRFDLYVAVNGRGDCHDLELTGPPSQVMAYKPMQGPYRD